MTRKKAKGERKAFTDEDFQRLRESGNLTDSEFADFLTSDKVMALIERLEAAEACAGYLGMLQDNQIGTNGRHFVEAWLRAAGRVG